MEKRMYRLLQRHSYDWKSNYNMLPSCRCISFGLWFGWSLCRFWWRWIWQKIITLTRDWFRRNSIQMFQLDFLTSISTEIDWPEATSVCCAALSAGIWKDTRGFGTPSSTWSSSAFDSVSWTGRGADVSDSDIRTMSASIHSEELMIYCEKRSL